MKVTVVRLRRWGEKLDPELIRQPHHGVSGDLTIDTSRSTRTGKVSQYAMLLRGFDGLLPPLREISKIKIREENILLVGIEEAPARWQKGYAEYPQAWWIRPWSPKPQPEGPGDQSASPDAGAMHTGPTT
ncbi:MAG: hypothetical protein EOP84_17415 [Verrucomicrobiaceae bacterium]|nr:MAG: hypothetical protein EOP84_17415 [Verrucomicrobiaceae bacterium]